MVASALEAFQKVLACIVNGHDDMLIGSLDIVPMGDIERIRKWNGVIPPRIESRIQDRVLQQCLLRPDAFAVQSWDGNLTYKELDTESNKLASHLQRLGVQPEVKVPLCFEKSKWAVVSQLAVLKAGGCVVPLGINQPPQRTRIILHDIEASIVLTMDKLAAHFRGQVSNVLAVDDTFLSQLPEPEEIPTCAAGPDSAAFIIYTSGSTGIPKGVVLTHSSLCTSLHYLGLRFRLGTHIRMVQFSAYTFDISIQDIYTTWHYGGCLCIISERDRISNLGAAMRSFSVNCAGLTSTVAGLVSPEEVPTLETLILLGEAVKPSVVNQWIKHVTVFNAYGPSECSIQSSCNELTPDCNALNIGFALAGALWVVDANNHDRLMPIGAAGELLIEGPLLARGYLNDENKTATTFITDPAWMSTYGFASTRQRRLYRTGDLVRQNTDGSTTYIGRRDLQIKVRGQRVEVGEIEHHLIQHADVIDAAVVFPRQGPCKDRLLALLTLREFHVAGHQKSDVVPVSIDNLATAKLQANGVSQYLSTHVPEHMVPKVWVPLTSIMPQNESGKLDRKRLGMWAETMDQGLFESMTAAGTCGSLLPRPRTGTLLESQIQSAWSKVLNLSADQIPFDGRSFLSCGGDSMAAMQVISHCRAQGISVNVRDVLRSQSVAQLARNVEETRQTHGNEASPRGEVFSPSLSRQQHSSTFIAHLSIQILEKLHNEVLPQLGLCPSDVEDIYPCSPIQQGILVSQAKSPSEYLIQQSFEVRPTGTPDEGLRVSVENLSGAWQRVVDRHSMLRTVFVPSITDAVNGSFDQLVLKSHTAEIDHKECDESEMTSELAVREIADLGFHTHGRPCHRLTIVRSIHSARVYIKLVISHALVDASSLLLMQKELVQAYDGVLAASTMGPPYRTYVRYLQQTPVHEAVRYWDTRLTDAEPCYLPPLTRSGFAQLEFGTRPPMQMSTGEIDGKDLEVIRAIGTTRGLTVANIFRLAWALVLSQYTGSTDVSFGYLTSGRDVPISRIDELVGPLINIIVARVKLDPEASVEKTLRQAQDDFLDDFAHQRAPLLDVLHSLKLQGRHLFNTTLSYRQAQPSQTQEGGKVTLDMVAVEDPTEYDASVSVLAASNSISVALQYSPFFMSCHGAARLVANLIETVRFLAHAPDAPIRKVQVAAPEDLRQICEWNRPTSETDRQRSLIIPDLVHQQRLLQPDAEAVCAWDGRLTYGELEDASSQLAQYLVSDLGVGPDVMVALCTEKSRWAVVAQLAVLKAGGAVVSMNPKHPLPRLQGILADTSTRVILTLPHHLGRLNGLVPHVLSVSEEMVGRLPLSPAVVFSTVKPENAAFVIYTSGSTGNPKGVILTHRSLCASFLAHGRAYGMDSGTRSLQFAAYTFDASISDIWATIAHGGCVCVISEEERMNGLQQAIESYHVNLAQLTPTVAGLLDAPTLATLKTLVLGGEAVEPNIVEGFLRAGKTKVLNGYGPSECSIYTTCSRPLGLTSYTSNIGRALIGGVWVVSTFYDSVTPIGSVGELWIEGPLLARGYLNSRAKTDASFVTNPPWAAKVPQLQGCRFYRTGDLVRQNSVGEIIYIGRRDTQIKIRGQRVEIGEIEQQAKKAIPQNLSFLKAIVATLVMPGGNNCNPMVAIVVETTDGCNMPSLEDNRNLDRISKPLPAAVSDELQDVFAQIYASLTDTLPSYMVPRLYVPFSRMPSTASGKLDRRLLRQVLEQLSDRDLLQYSLENLRGNSGAVSSPPTTATERQLQSLWAAVLGVEPGRIGACDHFFHEGGDSFTAMRLVSRANTAGLFLTVADVFQHPKLDDMARFIDLRQREQPKKTEQKENNEGGESDGKNDAILPPFALWKEAGPLSSDGCAATASPDLAQELRKVAAQCNVPVDAIEDVYPCTPLQEALMAVTAHRPDAYVNRWTYHMPPQIDRQRFKESWVVLAKVASILRTRIVPGQLCGALQVVVREDLVWLSNDEDNLDHYMSEDAAKPMTYGSPLVRFAVVPYAHGFCFVFTAHHSVYDGWSLARLFDAVTRIYRGQDSPSLPSFTKFIDYLNQQDLAAAESFWKSQLVGDAVTAPFPALPRPSYRPEPTQSLTYMLEATASTGTMTVAVLLRAAWALAVSTQSGNADVLFAAVLSGRTAPVPGIFDMPAPTITTVPLLICINGRMKVVEYLAAVQQQAIDMMAFEHTSLQRIGRLVGGRLEVGHLFAVQPANVRDSLTTVKPLGLEPRSVPASGADDYGLCVECITGLDRDNESAVEVHARFDEVMISRATLERLLARFKHIFCQLAEIANGSAENLTEDSTRIADVEVVSPEEVEQLVEWNCDIPERSCDTVHELVSRPSRTRPDAAAICSWDGNLSHVELEDLAERLAQHLAGLGVGPEIKVPLCLDKSKFVVVCMLGVLKAGGVVVPIRADPLQRVQAILHDTEAHIVLTMPHYAACFQQLGVTHVLSVDSALFASIPIAAGEVRQRAGPDNASFVIYTSGSTGVPKGVVIEHGSMSTSMQAHGARFGIGPETRAFQFASLTFDISLHDMLTTLQFGGCVCFPSEAERVNDLAGSMRSMCVNYSFLPPRVLSTILPSDVPDLRTIIVGGEAVQADHVAHWVRQTRVFNAYGPAECCIISTCNQLTDVAHSSNIGRALAGSLWVVDETDVNRLLPIGAVGELLIEGPLLARGYLNDAAKTSAAFVDSPAWASHYRQIQQLSPLNPGRRMYRTGDLVRQNDDGSLTYIGRRDNQVQIRGQRVEIGEIEHHLASHEAVEDAAVFYPARGPTSGRLVGLLVLRNVTGGKRTNPDPLAITSDQLPDGVNASVTSVREQLLECVPDYMIPSAWICLASMPQNSSNKIDRSRLLQWLQDLEQDRLERILIGQHEDSSEVPENTMQQRLQEVVADVLGLSLDKVTINRPFLAMGGDSISAMRVVSLSRTRYGVSVSVREVLQSRSISQLAQKASAGVFYDSEQAGPEDGTLLSMSPARSRVLQTNILSQTVITDTSSVQDVYPCSPIQQGIMMSQIKDQTTYMVHQVCEMKAADGSTLVDLDKLTRAWAAVVARHAILRTIFVSDASDQGLFYQVVLKRWTPHVQKIRCEEATNAVSVLAQDGRAIFSQGQPPHRLILCTVDATGETYARLDISHALIDASSLGLLLRDVVLAYDDGLPNTPAPSFGLYISFLQQQISADESLTYWTGRLAGAQPCHLPASAVPASKSRSMRAITRQFDDLGPLHSFRDACNITIANMVQLAWAIVLNRYTGSADIVFGYLSNGRDAPVKRIDEIVGPMINMMVSRILLLGEATVGQTAERVQEDFLEAFNNQRTSLGDIQHALRLSEHNLFNTAISYFRRSLEHDIQASSSLSVRSVSGEDPTEYDVNVTILMVGDSSMRLSLQYSTSFLDEASARCLLDGLQQALFTIAVNPESPLDKLDFMTPSDLKQLRLWNSHVPPAVEECVHHRIYRQRLAQPDAMAVRAWDGALTYAELDAMADRVAGHLRSHGIGEESIVGFCFEKSMWAIIAMLAVLKAGGVIVPLGVQLPPQRLRLILDNTKAAAVLASRQCVDRFSDIPVPNIMTIDEASVEALPEPSRQPVCPVQSAESAAVVIYTSGSTGTPKGVILTHKSLCTSLDEHCAQLGFGVCSRVLQFSAYVFDASLLDVFGTLRSGGCVCVVLEEDRMDVENMAVSMEKMGVNLAMLTPTVAGLINPNKVPTLRTLILVGEPIPPRAVEVWSGRVTLFNGYGPTECTILSSVGGPLRIGQPIDVGTPIAGVAWVVDQNDHNRLMPLGAVGELMMEGPIVARGYLHDPERTAASFITDPTFISQHGFTLERKMYRTGDLVRQNPTDGSITYIGRRDGQVKVRGQRVEVGEIEHWVKRLYTLSHAQTVAVDLVQPHVRGGESILVAAIELQVTRDASDTSDAQANDVTRLVPMTEYLRNSLSELRTALAEVLPSFMVPALYIPMRQMPLTTSGKLDRRQLRASLNNLSEEELSGCELTGGAAVVEASTETELRLCQLWAAALVVDIGRVGASSHFFCLGGDSVTAMRLVALAHQAEPVIPLGVADVFKNPILKIMAKVIDTKSATAASEAEAYTDVPPFMCASSSGFLQDDDLTRLAKQCNVPTEAIEDAYPCTPLQEGLLAVTARQPFAYVSHWAFRMDEHTDPERLRRAWQEVADLAPILRTRIIAGGESGAAGLQVVLREPLDWITVTTTDLQSYLTSRTTAERMAYGTRLVRFTVVTTLSGSFFIWTAHHSVYDGWTAARLLEAVGKVYSEQAAPEFAPYTRFIKYIQLTAARTEDAEAFWKSQLDGNLESGCFPATPPNYRPQSTSVAQHRVLTDSKYSGTITVATLLRAAWALTVSQEIDSQDVLFAAPLSGRTAPVPGILDIAAPTITTVPVRINVDRNRTVAEYLAAAQRQAVEMLPFEHTGLQKISEMLSGGEALPLNHLFVIQPFTDRLDHNGAASAIRGLELLPADESSPFYNYPLVLECSSVLGDQTGISSSVELEARFDETILSADIVQGMLERLAHFFHQLQTAAAAGIGNVDGNDGQLLLGDIDTPSPEDAARIRQWNTWVPTVPSPADSKKNNNPLCLHEHVYRQRLSRPDAQAVCSWDGELSYAQLDDLSLRLSQHLISLGVGPEIPVAVMFEKSLWAIVAQLAVLKAGGVVMPVNYKHPVQRIRDIVEVTGATIMLTSRHTYPHANRCHSMLQRILVVDEPFSASRIPDQKLPPMVRPTNAAFIIFTSGSTGVPKGVLLEHSALVTSLEAEAALFSKAERTRTLQFSAYTFDVSIAEIFMTLMVGGCVCIVSEEDRLSNLAAAMGVTGVNLAYLTPTVVGLLQVQQVPALETLVIIGEALRPEVIGSWIGEGSHVQLFNAYGPAECCVLSTCSRPIIDKSMAPNIGRGIAGSNLWIVDPSDYHRLAPIGAVGELLIEGPILARGYVCDEEKTASAFVTDPAWVQHLSSSGPGHPGRRFYRTGDLVQQRRSDGSLVYLGRRDTQAKIHGQRVEIGEIEYWVKKKLPTNQVRAVMAGLITRSVSQDSSSSVSTESVLAVALEIEMAETPERKAGAAPLALLPLTASQRETFGQLRESLYEVLPSYMVPRLFIPVDRLPLTDSGKLDRRLTWRVIEQHGSWSPYSLSSMTNQSKVLPFTDTERQLQQLWASVLRVPIEEIGAHDDFFRSGGDSISAMRLVAKARKVGQIPLSVAEIFEHPVLSDLAAVADSKREEGELVEQQPSSCTPFSLLETSGETTEDIRRSLTSLLSDQEAVAADATPVTDFQALSVILTMRSSRDLLAHISLDSQSKSYCDIEGWKESCWKLVARHEALRTAYVFHRDRLVQVVLSEYRPDIAHFEIADSTTSIDDFTSKLIAQDMQRPPRLGRPFVEFAVITHSTLHQRRILFRLSHAEYDAISLFHLFEDLKAIRTGEDTTDSYHPSPTRYMATVLTRGVEDREASLCYWRVLLRGSIMPRISDMPSPRRPARLIHHATRTVTLPPPTKAKVSTTTPATLVRAAWALVLAQHTGRTDVLFGDVVSGRNGGTTDPVIAAAAIGCCANVVPMRVNLDSATATTAADLLAAVQAQQVARLPHETVGFRDTLKECGGGELFFTSRVNHLDRATEWSLALGLREDRKYKVTLALPDGAQDLTDVSITSIAMDGECRRIQIAFGYLDGVISASLAEELLCALCRAIEILAAEGSRVLSLRELIGSSGLNKIENRNWKGVENEASGVTSNDKGQVEESTGVVHDRDVIRAGYRAFAFQQRGIEVTVDDVLDGAVRS